MAQTARPDSLVSNVGWTASSGSNYWDLVDEAVADDGDYIGHPGGGLDTIELGLGSLSDPMSSASHTIYFRARWVTLLNSFTIRLVENATVIASHSPTLTNSFADYSYTLSAGEANAITDYSDLRIRCVSSGNPVDISQIYFQVPNAAVSSGGFTHVQSDPMEIVKTCFDRNVDPGPFPNRREFVFLSDNFGSSDSIPWWEQPVSPADARNGIVWGDFRYPARLVVTVDGKRYPKMYAPRKRNASSDVF